MLHVSCLSELDHIHHHSKDDNAQISLFPATFLSKYQIFPQPDMYNDCRMDENDKFYLPKTKKECRDQAKKPSDKSILKII